MSSQPGDTTVNFVVGGVYYSLLLSDIHAHKDSYFASVIKDEWTNSNQPIVIDRDGFLFHHIVGFIYNRRNNFLFAVKGSLSLLVGIRREADYYNLTELAELCDRSYERELTKWCKEQPLQDLCSAYIMQSQSSECCELDKIVASEIYSGCLAGTLDSARVARVDLANALSRAQLSVNEEQQKEFYYLYDQYECLESLQELLPTLPGVSCCLSRSGMFAVKTGGYQNLSSLGAQNTKRIGTALYIMDSEYTDGVVTASRNGVSHSITKPGEYIIYTSDHTRTISTVTSGTLVFAKLDLVSEIELAFDTGDVFPSLVPYDPLSVSTCEKMIHAVHTELSGNSACMVLCLSTLYPIVEFSLTGPYLETDPDILTDRDAVLYEYLKGTFDVTLVTVYVQRYAHDVKGCVIAPIPDSSSGSKVKIIAPFHGFRESFEVCSGDEGNSRKEFATLYTAVYVSSN